MVGKGGNTRLTALQELFSETGDAAFQYVVVTYWYVQLEATRRAKQRIALFCAKELELAQEGTS
jgi:hypothetical protein